VGGIALVGVGGCSPPNQQLIAQCKAVAIAQAHGHSLQASDVAELTEACVMTKGYEPKEEGSACPDNVATTTPAQCYYPANFFGRIGERLFGR